jgi:hypothetical protein
VSANSTPRETIQGTRRDEPDIRPQTLGLGKIV